MWRFRFLSIFIALIYLLLIVRLFFIQVIGGSKYKIAASSQHFFEMVIPANRGNIYTSDGSILAMNTDAYLVYAQPRLIGDKARFIKDIAKVMDVDEISLKDKLSDNSLYWLPLFHKVDPLQVEKLQSLNLTGIGYESESVRYYPEASMAANLLGFVAMDLDGKDKGYFGLEGYYDRDLSGKNGTVKFERDANGDQIILANNKRIPPENGRSMTLWLDRMVQHIADVRLKAGIEKYGAKEGTVTIMDPKTGGILAMSTYPTYDQAHFNQYPDNLYKNAIVASSYEPGSTFKVLVMAAGIQENIITPDFVMNEDGPVKIGEYVIRTWDNQYHGSVTMTDVLIHSSNVGMVFIERKLGPKKLLDYIHGYGFGKPTGIDLEEELSPELRPDNDWKDIDFATSSFGQGIAVTPLQMIRAVSAIANDGMMMAPKMVKEIKDQNGKVIKISPQKIKQIISPETARIVTEMMIAAVDKGESKWAKPKGYRIAGKTGTAQIPVAGHYDDKKTIASFVGFAPADNPKFVILVTLREPSSSQWGSETAAPLFFDIAQDLFLYYGIPPNLN
jgi:stage V sporulation protein D (sporulation-specific penicillin-binding protein)